MSNYTEQFPWKDFGYNFFFRNQFKINDIEHHESQKQNKIIKKLRQAAKIFTAYKEHYKIA